MFLCGICQQPNKAKLGHLRGHNRNTLTQSACKPCAVSADGAVSAFSHQPQAEICMSQSSPALPNVEIEIKTNLQNALQHDQDYTHDTISPMSYVGNLKGGLI